MPTMMVDRQACRLPHNVLESFISSAMSIRVVCMRVAEGHCTNMGLLHVVGLGARSLGWPLHRGHPGGHPQHDHSLGGLLFACEC